MYLEKVEIICISIFYNIESISYLFIIIIFVEEFLKFTFLQFKLI